MNDVKKLELNLYDESCGSKLNRKSVLGRRIGAIKNYFVRPSTHAGFYFSGIGCFIGGLGGLARGLTSSLSSDGPEIITKLSVGDWHGAIYHFASLATKSFFDAAYTAGAGGFIGYIGGSIITGKIWDSLISFFGFK